jgi:hypothetical protein
MAARSSGWLLLPLVVLSAVLAAELHYGVGKGAGRQPADTAGTAAVMPPVPLFALAARETFTETVTRPLFMPNRQPAGAADAPAAAPAAPTARPNANRYTLSAVIIVDDERIALVTDTATGDSNRVREGESFAGWQVEAIRDDSAVLSNGDTREELSLRTFAPPDAARGGAPQGRRRRSRPGRRSGRVAGPSAAAETGSPPDARDSRSRDQLRAPPPPLRPGKGLSPGLFPFRISLNIRS